MFAQYYGKGFSCVHNNLRNGIRNYWFGLGLWSFKNISIISRWPVLLMEETGVLRENHRPAASHCQTLSHNVVSSSHI